MDQGASVDIDRGAHRPARAAEVLELLDDLGDSPGFALHGLVRLESFRALATILFIVKHELKEAANRRQRIVDLVSEAADEDRQCVEVRHVGIIAADLAVVGRHGRGGLGGRGGAERDVALDESGERREPEGLGKDGVGAGGEGSPASAATGTAAPRKRGRHHRVRRHRLISGRPSHRCRHDRHGLRSLRRSRSPDGPIGGSSRAAPDLGRRGPARPRQLGQEPVRDENTSGEQLVLF